MSNPVYIVGLDIGPTQIACIVGEKVENGKIVIRGYGKTESTGVKRGMVFNIEETVNAIRRAVDQASEQSNVDIKTVNVGIAGHHIRSVQHQPINEMHQKLQCLQPAMVNRRGPILLRDNAQPHIA